MLRPTLAAITILFAPLAGSAQQQQADPAVDRCRGASHAHIERSQARARQESLASLNRALSARGLKRVGVQRDRLVLHRGPPGLAGPNPRRALPLGKATRATIRGKTGVFVGGPSAWGGNARPPEAWTFVQNQRGEIFRLIRAPKVRDASIQVCGCEPVSCGPYGSGCPACFDTAQTVYGPLPAGAVYRGDLAVSYPAVRVTLRYTKTNCQRRACPGPPRTNRTRR